MEWLSNIPGAVSRFLSGLRLRDFQGKRIAFYEELAKSFESREQFKTFLVEELRIARDPKTSDSSRAYALATMYRHLAFGEGFRMSEIIGKVMPASDRLMLTALDHTRHKPETLRMLADSLRQQAEVTAIIRKAVLPPMILIPGIAAFCYVMSTISLPIMVKMAPPSVWTPFNQAVRSFCEWVAESGVLSAFIAVAVVGLFSYALPRWNGILRSTCEQLSRAVGFMLLPVCPFLLPLSIYRDFKVSLLLSSLAVLLQSGLTLTEGLRALLPNATPWLRWHITRILISLQINPTEYVGAFSQGLIGPKLLARLSSSIRHNPQFDRLIIKLGTTENAQVREEIASVARLLNLVILLALGGLIMFLYVGQFSISSDLADALGREGQRR
jgi:type II secretory pathway component PulF